MKIISDCPLCDAHGLHVIGEKGMQIMQCLNCGYVSSDKYLLEDNQPIDQHAEYKKFPENMKRMSVTNNNRIWIPTVMTLPDGMIYPIQTEEKITWHLALMIDIPKDEQNKFPNELGGYHTKRYDDTNALIYDTFFEAMVYLNQLSKQKQPNVTKLPTLKKIDNNGI